MQTDVDICHSQIHIYFSEIREEQHSIPPTFTEVFLHEYFTYSVSMVTEYGFHGSHAFWGGL